MATNMFLNFQLGKNVPGESEDEIGTGHLKWVEVTSWSHGFEQPTNPARSQSGGTIEKCLHNPFSVTRKMDAASIHIMSACWGGMVFPALVFEAYRAQSQDPGSNDPVKYIQVEMKHVIVASYEISGGEGDIPEETVTFNYGYIRYQYTPMDKKTSESGDPVSHSHNLITNKIG